MIICPQIKCHQCRAVSSIVNEGAEDCVNEKKRARFSRENTQKGRSF